MRPALPMAVAAAIAAAPASAMDDVDVCGARLDAVRAAMAARSPLKEELATGLMWLQIEAKDAWTSGDAVTCDLALTRMEALLPPGK